MKLSDKSKPVPARIVRRSVSVPTSLCANSSSSSSSSSDQEDKRARKFNFRGISFLKFIRSTSSSSSSSTGSDVEVESDQEGYTSDSDETVNYSDQELVEECSIEPIRQQECHRALQIPEILRIIFKYLDEYNQIPHEQAPKRRSPMSLRHALLLYGDNPSARQAWKQAQQQKQPQQPQTLVGETNGAGLYSCLLVNPQWYEIASDVLYGKLHFRNSACWQKFTNQGVVRESVHSRCLVLHKVQQAKQLDIEALAPMGGNLKWLEFYTCLNIVPTKALLQGGRLIKLVLPGCNRVDDRVVRMVAELCPQLLSLDLRACEKVTDRGIRAIAKHCRQLTMLNVGRTQRGEAITHKSIKHIVRRTNVTTLGVAGCAIDDNTVWEVALRRGRLMERLSLNNCILLTNASIPKVLGHIADISVLELRGCTAITDMRPIVMFKKYRHRLNKPPLIEGCEVFELRMKEAEWTLEMEWSRQVFRDCLEWIYADDDDNDSLVA